MKKDKKIKKILLIGGTGFIGNELSKQLVNEKNKINIICHSSLKKGNRIKNATYFKIDLSKNKSRFLLENLINKADAIVIMTQPNYEIIKNIILAIKKNKKSKKIIYLSTLLLYPDSPKKNAENIFPKPKTKYEKEKMKEEVILSKFCKKNNYKLCIARLANVFGNPDDKGIIGRIFSSILSKGKLIINGKGEQIRDYIFIDDAVKLLIFLIFLDQKKDKEIFNICTAKGYSILDLIKIIEKNIKKKVEFIFAKAIPEKKINIGDNKKIIKYSRYYFKNNLTELLKKTYNSYLKKQKHG